jgi:hypothetical protein
MVAGVLALMPDGSAVVEMMADYVVINATLSALATDVCYHSFAWVVQTPSLAGSFRLRPGPAEVTI